MNFIQTIAATLGVQYVAIVCHEYAFIARASQITKGVWVTPKDGERLLPGGRMAASRGKWLPLTPKVKAFFDVEVV